MSKYMQLLLERDCIRLIGNQTYVSQRTPTERPGLLEQCASDRLIHSNRRHVFKRLMPIVKHGGVNVVVWGCSAAAGPGKLSIIKFTMNYLLYQRVVEEHVRPSVRKFKLKQMWTMQHDNDPKQSSKSNKNLAQKKKLSSGMAKSNPNKRSNITQLKDFYMEDWDKLSSI